MVPSEVPPNRIPRSKDWKEEDDEKNSDCNRRHPALQEWWVVIVRATGRRVDRHRRWSSCSYRSARGQDNYNEQNVHQEPYSHNEEESAHETTIVDLKSAEPTPASYPARSRQHCVRGRSRFSAAGTIWHPPRPLGPERFASVQDRSQPSRAQHSRLCAFEHSCPFGYASSMHHPARAGQGWLISQDGRPQPAIPEQGPGHEAWLNIAAR